MSDVSLARQVAHLKAGDTITAVIHPTDDTAYQIGPCTLTETPAGALIIGDGWEAARLPDGTPPAYLKAIRRHITEPSFLYGVPDDVYHSGGVQTPGPQVSQTALKLLIPPSTPAHFHYQQTAPQQAKRAFDIGRAAHTMALGVGEPMAACPAEYLSVDGKMTTTKAKSWAYLRREEGVVPLAPADYDMVMRMADALVRHDRIAEVLTDPDKQPEVSAYAPHPIGIWLRGRFDLMGSHLWDYKTTGTSADPDAFRKAAWSYGYHLQDEVYRLLLELVTGTRPDPTVFIVQEKTPPYLVSTVTLDGQFSDLARRQLDDALALYAECAEAGHWPGYPDEIVTISPPAFVLRDLEQTTTTETAEWLLSDLEGILQ